MSRFHRTTVTALIAAAALVSSPAAFAGKPSHRGAAVFRGTVVHINKRARSFTVATSKGVMRPIHARKLPRLGEVVIVRAQRLRDGTYRLRSLKVVRHKRGARHVRLRGVVSYVNPARRLFVLSGQGVSLTVHERPAVRIAAAALPTVGEREVVSGSLEPNGTVTAEGLQSEGSTTGPFDIEGVVISLDPTARTITVSAEDDNKLAATLTVNVPASLPFPSYATGEEVELQVQQGETGLTLTGASSDDGETGANDGAKAEGEPTEAADREDAAEEGDNSEGEEQSEAGAGQTVNHGD